MGKTIVLGLDAFHTDLFDLANLTNIERIWENSVHGELESTVPPLTITAWSVLHTGVPEGDHGLYRFADPGSDSFVSAKDVESVYFSEALREQNQEVFMMGIPLTYPARIDGDVVSGWMAQSDNFEDYLHPINLKDRFSSIADYQPFKLMGEGVQPIIDSFEIKANITYEILEEGEYDLEFFYISETDWVQHEAYPEFAQQDGSEAHKLTKDLFERVDEYVGKVQEMLDEDDQLILMSDHGFQLFEGEFFINNWLYEQGHLELKGKSETNTGANVGFAQKIIRQFPQLLEPAKRVKSLLAGTAGIELHSDPPISEEKSKAYAPGMVVDHEKTDNVLDYYIRINEENIENPDEFVDELLDGLNSFDGITAVIKDDIPGEKKKDLIPDILLIDDGYNFNHNILGKNFRQEITGGHETFGIFCLQGKDVDPKHLSDLYAVQFAPTLLHVMGQEIPQQMQGKVIEPVKQQSSPRYYDSEYPKLENLGDTTMDEEVYRERLEDLGYI